MGGYGDCESVVVREAGLVEWCGVGGGVFLDSVWVSWGLIVGALGD